MGSPARTTATARPAAAARVQRPAAPAAVAAAPLGNAALGRLLAGSADLESAAAEAAADDAARLILSSGAAAAATAATPAAPLPVLRPPRHDLPPHVRHALDEPAEALPHALAAAWRGPLGTELDGVRVHRGPQAARSAAQLGARAYAHGNRIVFGAGQWRPDDGAGRALIAHEVAHLVQQRAAAGRAAPIQAKKLPGQDFTPVEVHAATFDEAAQVFATMLETISHVAGTRVVIVNGPNVRVYDDKGKPLSKKFFHLTVPTTLPSGVFAAKPGRRGLHVFGLNQQGQWYDAGRLAMEGTIDFAKHIDDQEGFDGLLSPTKPVIYVAPTSTAAPPEADAPPPVPIENLPEFMQFEAKTKANLPPWPSATVPLTPQLATVDSTGSFLCRVDKNQGAVMIDRVTNLMQTTQFRWEVLKLDEKLRVQGKRGVDFWDGAKEGYSRRMRQLKDDREAMLGNRKRQSVPESVMRVAMANQIQGSRTALAMVGQTVMTAINAITGGPNQLSTEATIDVPWKEQGDYFVRCLATQVVPKDAKYRRATSVSGVMVSVYDIEDVAREGLLDASDISGGADQSADALRKQIDAIDGQLADGEGDAVALGLKRAMLAIDLDYQRDVSKAGANPLDAKVAEQNMLRAKIAYVESDEYPAGPPYDSIKAVSLQQLKDEAKKVDAVVARRRGALKERDEQIEPVGYMRGVLIDEVTAARSELAFAVGERRYIAAGKLEVVIADVTGSKGRTFTGSGSGALGAGRQDAWIDALTDLRRNLNRGRGYLAYEVPARYKAWKGELPNPMKLEMSVGAQLKETVDDAAQALTIAALLAAPFTGGASLSILAVLAPIQAASSLYNIVNRAAYDDLELDQEAVFNLIDVATLGLAKASTLSKTGARGLEIVASSSKVAVRLLNGGQFIVVSYTTFQTLMEEGDPGADPREVRRKKLKALLGWCQQASIPVAQKLYAEAHGTGAKPPRQQADIDAGRVFETPLEVSGKARKPTVREGGFVEPRPPGGTGDAGAAPRVADAAPPPATKPPAAQLRGLPKALDGKVAVVEGLDKDARVAYKRGDNGLITDVQIQIGPRTSAADVRAHAEIAQLMLGYSGLSGRIRVLLGRFVGLFLGSSNERAAVGSRAWESRLELRKLDRMMRERHAELAKLADKPPSERDAARQRELLHDLDALELQFREHAQVYNTIEMGGAAGRGFVAAEDLAAGERVRTERGLPKAPSGYRWRWRKGQLEVVADAGRPKRYWDPSTKSFPIDKRVRAPERFDAGTSRREAFRELGGYDADSSFGSFVKILLEQRIIKSRQEVIDAMGEPSGRTHDTVRGNVKEGFRQQLAAQLSNPAYLKKTARYKEVRAGGGSDRQAQRAAAMDELARISERIDSGDRGSLGEQVYQQMFGGSRTVTQVDVTPDQLAAARGVDPSAVGRGRRIDRVEGDGTAREVKNVSTRMGPEQRGEIGDMVAMIGSEVTPRGGKPRTVTRVAVALLDPAGGKANASLAHSLLETHKGADLSFEFHTRSGKVITVNFKNRHLLTDDGFAAMLGITE